uniref:Uncharacterized protein n=1 Tax=Anopheles atroparvus TaxID=41427 RepID=A0A182J8U5_ANOAO
MEFEYVGRGETDLLPFVCGAGEGGDRPPFAASWPFWPNLAEPTELNTGMRDGLALVREPPEIELRLLIEPPVVLLLLPPPPVPPLLIEPDGDRLMDGMDVRRISTGISVFEFERSKLDRS